MPRWGWLMAAALATAAAVLHACGGDTAGSAADPGVEDPDAGGPTGGGGGRPPPERDATDARGPVIDPNPIVHCTPSDLDAAAPYARVRVGGDAPLPNGGAVVPGSYQLERRTTYTGTVSTLGPDAGSWLREVVDLTANERQVTTETFDCPPVFGAPCGVGTASRRQRYTVVGAELRFTDLVCGGPFLGGAPPASTSFSTDGGALDLFYGSEVAGGVATVDTYRRR